MFLKNFWRSGIKKIKKAPCLLFCFLISFYKAFLSGNLMMGGSCRFYPSCSDYAFFVYKKYPFLKASRLFLARLLHCQPFGPKVRQEPELKDFI